MITPAVEVVPRMTLPSSHLYLGPLKVPSQYIEHSIIVVVLKRLYQIGT